MREVDGCTCPIDRAASAIDSAGIPDVAPNLLKLGERHPVG